MSAACGTDNMVWVIVWRGTVAAKGHRANASGADPWNRSQTHAARIGGEPDTDPARRLRIGGSSVSHVRACFRAGDPPTLALALDVCGEPTSSRSRSSQVYAGRIGGMATGARGSGGGAEYDAKRACSDS